MSDFKKIRIGMFTLGLEAYWNQIPNMKKEISAYSNIVKERLETFCEVVYAGIADTNQNCKKIETVFIKNNIDIIIIHAATYGLSKSVINSIKKFDLPILTLHLQPIESFEANFSAEYTLPKNTFAVAGELGAIFKRFGIEFHSIFGTLHEEKAWHEIEDYIELAYVKKKISNSNIALLGETYPGMLDLYIDKPMFMKKFGINIEEFEMGVIQNELDEISNKDISGRYSEIRDKFIFDFNTEKVKEEFNWHIKVSIAMEKLIHSYNIDGLSYHNFGFPGSTEERIGYSLVLGGLLLNNKGIPVCCEGDIPNIIAMLILKFISGVATQAENYYADYLNNFQYISHSGPGDIKMASEKPILKWLDFFHGKHGGGVSCEFSIKEGPITMMSISQHADGEIRMIAAEGIALKGSVPTGEVTTKVQFNKVVRQFMKEWTEEGPSHHSSVCIGHISNKLEKFAGILDIEFSNI